MNREDEEFERKYGEYITQHAAGDRLICNGNDLVLAMEDGYLWEEYCIYNERRDRSVNGNQRREDYETTFGV